MTQRRLPFALLACIVTVLSAAHEADATTIVAMSDENLALSARAIVEGRVESTECLWSAEESVAYSYVTIDVERSYKGDVPPGLVVLKQLGGTAELGSTEIFGAPSLAPGQRAIFFLNTDREGALHVAHLSLGFFRVESDPATGEEVVVRPAATLATADDLAASDRPRRLEFLASIRAIVDGKAAAEGPLRLAPVEYVHAGHLPHENFTFLQPGFRWFEPDSGATVRFSVNPAGALTPSRGADEARATADSWSSVPGSSLRVGIAGTTSAAGFRGDGVSAISFGDPLGQIDPPVNCQGVVAIGGVSSADPSRKVSIGGKQFARILEGDVVFNTGFDCILSSEEIVEEVMTHEIGHALGLGHSSEDPDEADPVLHAATMYFAVHGDGRGAGLEQDDFDAIRFLYAGGQPEPSAPVVERAAFNAEKGRLTIMGRGFDDDATVTVNGREVAPESVRFVAAKGRLKVSGSAVDLGIGPAGQNAVTVTVGGRVSNVASF